MGKALTFVGLLLLAGCAHEPTGGAGGAFCDATQPFRFSRKVVSTMTRTDKEQVVSHNARGERECGWKP